MARTYLLEFNKWWTGIWERSNAGKVGILLILFAFALPFLIVLGTAFVAWFYIWPLASSVTERLAVLPGVFAVKATTTKVTTPRPTLTAGVRAHSIVPPPR